MLEIHEHLKLVKDDHQRNIMNLQESHSGETNELRKQKDNLIEQLKTSHD